MRYVVKNKSSTKSSTQLARIGTVAKILGIPLRRLQYHVHKKHLDFYSDVRGRRTFSCFTLLQISEAKKYFAIRDRIIVKAI